MDAVEFLAVYNGLARFDTHKTEMLAKWDKDKSCKWIHSYSKTMESVVAKAENGAEGFCTKCPTCTYNI